MKTICLISLLTATLAGAAHGQAAAGKGTAGGDKSDLNTAAERLLKAKEGMDLEKARQTAEGVLEKLPPKMSETAKEALESKETRDKAVDAAKTAAEKLLPEAQKLLKDRKAGDTPPGATPAGTTAPPAPAAPPGPAPVPLQPIPDATQVQSKNAITIDADELTSDLKNAIFVYSGHVRARHPQFAIECEELEVHMVKEDEMPEKKEKPNVDPVQAPASKKDANSRIKLAIARGPRVTIEKVSETGEIQRGQCKRAVYHGDTKEIVMSEYPQIQSGNLLHIATDPSTEMVFDPDGKFHATGGRQRTIVLSAETAPGGGTSSPLDPLSNRKAQ